MVAKYCPKQHSFYRELGTRLKTHRKSMALSMDDLAIDTELSRSTIISLERGNVKISAYNLMKVLNRIEMQSAILDEIFIIAGVKPSKRRKDNDLKGYVHGAN